MLAMTGNMFDWHLLLPDVCPLEEGFLFVLLLFWICFFFSLFVCVFVHMHVFTKNNINTSFLTSSFFDICGAQTSLLIYCVGGEEVSMCVCCASVVKGMTLSNDFSLIIGYLIATLTFKFGPLNIVMCCFHICAGSRSWGSYISSGSLECLINVL